MVKRIGLILLVSLLFSFLGGHLFAKTQSGTVQNIEALMLKDAYSQAVKECEMILAQRPQRKIRSKVHYLLGVCLLEESEFIQARKHFNLVLKRYAGSKFCDDASLGIAETYFLAGDYTQASEKYSEFLQDFARSELTSIARMHLKQCKQGKGLANSYFSVQLGCFSDRKNAQKLRDELIDQGYRAYILDLPTSNLYHVRVGKFSERIQAELLEQRFKTEGYSTKVCP